MLRIKRLKVLIEASGNIYGIDEKLTDNLNLILSIDNTYGKSSILDAIYYALGFEEIIGNKKGFQVLTSVYKSQIQIGDTLYDVASSKVYLEISNGSKTITIHRAAKSDQDDKLVTVFFSTIDSINNASTKSEYMYVHMQNSATNPKGFHAFLETFLNLKLPLVLDSNGTERKLYLQLIFSAIFIEQKRGWADLFSGMPILGIREAKRRVIEYLLNLEVINNEKKQEELKIIDFEIKKEWEYITKKLNAEAQALNFSINLPIEPTEMTITELDNVKAIYKDLPIERYLNVLKSNLTKYSEHVPQPIENFEELELELKENELLIAKLEEQKNERIRLLVTENANITRLDDNLELLSADLINNQDAAKIQKLGADMGHSSFNNICPVCRQATNDSLLNLSNLKVMTIEENISHLKTQIETFEYALQSHEQNMINYKEDIALCNNEISRLIKLNRSIRNDLYQNNSISESAMRKKIDLENSIEKLDTFAKLIQESKAMYSELSAKWLQYLKDKQALPKSRLSKSDDKKIDYLKNIFVNHLNTYGYKSLSNMDNVEISKLTYLPINENFDMKFDSSASDNIKAIWAYTVGLMQTSNVNGGNHPNILIFDEPRQHSITPDGMKSFIKSIYQQKQCQVIVGITAPEESDIYKYVQTLEGVNIITVKNKAFQKL